MSGLALYVQMDSPNGDAVRWPGISLMTLGVISAIVTNLGRRPTSPVSNKAPGRMSTLFKVSLACLSLAVVCLICLWSGISFGGDPGVIFSLSDILFMWGVIILGPIGLILLFISLFTKRVH